ncbi:nucleoside transporter 3, putative [Hepatocystis sp. ex Piliocolobus tephrosceles]|nr:nucleoside transporter 3, putative [Hepatocystis sp. ex Piliocolobus tephrosceles]
MDNPNKLVIDPYDANKEEFKNNKINDVTNEQNFKEYNKLEEGLYITDEEKLLEIEEKKYYALLSVAYGLMGIIADAPFYFIVSMSDYFKRAFNVKDVMIIKFTLMESIILIIVCILLHLIGSYRLKWNLYQPLCLAFFVSILFFTVHLRNDYIGHRIVIYSIIPFATTACIIKMTSLKICVLFKKQHCSAYICGLSLSGFLVFILYVLGAYVFWEYDNNKFKKLFSLFCAVIICLSIMCYLILNRIYKLPFVIKIAEKNEDKGFFINKQILIDSYKCVPVIYKYIILGFVSNFICYQIYPTIFPTCIDTTQETKGLLSGMILCGDSVAHLLVHFYRKYVVKVRIIFFILSCSVMFLPIFVIIVIDTESFFNKLICLIILSYLFGFSHGLISNSVFLKLPGICEKKNKQKYLKTASNIIFLSFMFGVMIGVFVSKFVSQYVISLKHKIE